ncbi:MAG: 1-(5-phosphoribosyl)-5-[(5-phosphoribosylamino)methylideneamino]imidazole-4-carboxamide isomerase [Actinomycetia bacterium]|nr:1-(5-phosphoribosyl)-5-[(5-phosphoribosylamino)methylideneamino]imidazole-4-carboxamide isomerase [Actinomycetes bacterium]
MDLYPAIDLLGGQCVRLYQGDYEQSTVYGHDPVSQALAFQEAGAGWIHVVDLDAARSGDPVNRRVVAAIAEAVDVPVQTGGGVRDIAAAQALFAAGVERVVIGTAALENPDLVRELAGSHPVAVGLDARGGEVATHGWLEGSGRTVFDLAEAFANAGVAAFVVTDIGRDGTLEGPDVDGLTELVGRTEVDVIASGGVGTLAHLEELAAVDVAGRRLSGAIVGKAIYERTVAVDDAVRVLGGRAMGSGS